MTRRVAQPGWSRLGDINMKCGFCGKEIILNGSKGNKEGMTLNKRTDGNIVHDACYREKFGTDPLEDMMKPQNRE